MCGSVMKFVEDAEDDCTKIVDSLLDVLTKGQHSATMKQIHEKRKQDEKQKAALKKTMMFSQNDPEEADFSTANTTADGGEGKPDVQQRLDRTADLLRELHQAQHERLSQRPPPHLTNTLGPGDTEKHLADNVTSELTSLAKEAYPRDVTSLRGIRKALGISVESVIGTDESQPIEIEDGDSFSQSNVSLQNDQDNSQLEAAYSYDNNDGHQNIIDNELLMETDGTVIDNL
ncbi:bromodomain-containing protein 7-like [Dreissena polymorpha]|uniref:bromodomain-containing protein 7-like n=1 Tax=Dreissena polymorpha TaxID=45954 RepID=UPI002265054B|nr:bromodomain-containing protein 7-like [Dreissena polymorpha]